MFEKGQTDKTRDNFRLSRKLLLKRSSAGREETNNGKVWYCTGAAINQCFMVRSVNLAGGRKLGRESSYQYYHQDMTNKIQTHQHVIFNFTLITVINSTVISMSMQEERVILLTSRECCCYQFLLGLSLAHHHSLID